ncbi:hypothetical protein [Candidatus Protochlamydia phocaeensis]|uniref:hypothetical protein n=1 Tax=Candidatus Protochlamydia phocaeensis TaxID=1414722 RepID=UPI000837FB60|nr:hypothetical protein [Candidatus Protochlamydia phocaeensis]
MSFNPLTIPPECRFIPSPEEITRRYKASEALYNKFSGSNPEFQYFEASSRLKFAQDSINQGDRKEAGIQSLKAHGLFYQLHLSNPDRYGMQDVRACANLFQSTMSAKL